MSNPAPREPWHLDRRVPLALILTIAIQTGGAIWWASSLSASVRAQDERLRVLEGARTDERLAVLESQMAGVKVQLDRIESKLDRLAGYPAK